MRRWAAIAGGLLLLYFAVCALSYARSYIDPHDGSSIAMVARSVAFEGRYGLKVYDRFEVWPAEATTTGPTLVLPIAAGLRLAGDGPFVPNVVSAIVTLALLVILWSLLVVDLTSLPRMVSALVALGLIFTVTIKPFAAFVVPRGELAASLLLVIATIVALRGAPAASRLRLATSGLLIGLAVAAKVIVLLPAACLGLVIVSHAAEVSRPRREVVRNLTAWLAGIVIVVAAVELYKLFELGSLAAYARNWRAFAEFFRVAGSGLESTPSLLAERRTLAYRLDVLFEALGWTMAAFAGALLLLPPLVWRALRSGVQTSGRIAIALGAEAVMVLLWWLGFAGIPWLRYAFIALVTLPLFVHFALLEIGAERPSRAGRLALPAWLACLVVTLAFSPAGTFDAIVPAREMAPRTIAVLDAAQSVAALTAADPGARFWSAGWWRHWDLQNVVRIELGDLFDEHADERLGRGRDYLITSDYFNWEQDPRLRYLLDAHRGQVVFHNQFFTIYRLNPGLTHKALHRTSS